MTPTGPGTFEERERLMPTPCRFWLGAAAIYGFIAVAAGAFGAHGLRDLEERYLAAFKTGALYHMFHALGLLGVALLPRTRAVQLAGWSFLIGTAIFSGTLYGLALTRIGLLGMITPIGGLLMLVGWAALLVAAVMPARVPKG